MQLLNDKCRDLRRQKTLESVTKAINYVYDWVWSLQDAIYTRGSIPESSSSKFLSSNKSNM